MLLRLLFPGQPEMPVELLIWCAGTETGHADKGSVCADDGIPALPDAGFDRDIHFCRADDSRALDFR